MNRRNLFKVFCLTALIVSLLGACNKETGGNGSPPLVPIYLLSPDSAITTVIAGDSSAIQIKYTTDRPIDWILGLYDVDTLVNSPNYVPTYPDTLFSKSLYNLNPRLNLYTYSGSFTVADTIRPFSIIRFKTLFVAGDTVFHNGQNYPAGIVSGSMEFVINVR